MGNTQKQKRVKMQGVREVSNISCISQTNSASNTALKTEDDDVKVAQGRHLKHQMDITAASRLH